MNIEGLRCGGAPAASPAIAEPAGISFFEWPDGDENGWRPDDPVTGRLGGDVLIHRYADIRECGRCGGEFVSPAYLAAHKEREHGRE